MTGYNEEKKVDSQSDNVVFAKGRISFIEEAEKPEAVPEENLSTSPTVSNLHEARSEELKSACVDLENEKQASSVETPMPENSPVVGENTKTQEEVNYAKQVLSENAVLLKQHTKVTASAIKKNFRKHKGLLVLLFLVVGFIVLIKVAMGGGGKKSGEYDEFKLTQISSDQTNQNKDILQQGKDGVVVKKESQSDLTFTDITGKENQERMRKEKEKQEKDKKNTTTSSSQTSTTSSTTPQTNNSSSSNRNNYTSNSNTQQKQPETQQKNNSSWSWDDVASTDGTSVKQNSSSASSDGSSVAIPPGFLIYCDIRSATEIDENNVLVTGISRDSHPQYNIQKGTIFYGQVYDLKTGANKAYVRFNRMVTNGKVYGITALIMDVNKTDGITVIINKHTLSNAGKKIVNTTIDITSTVVTPGPLSDTGNTVSSSLKGELRGATASIPGGKKFYVRF